jgi:hypothetical protein
MGRRWAVVAAAWIAAAVLTTLAGVYAVNSLGDGLLGSASRPISQDDVNRRLSSAPPVPPPSLSAGPSSSGAPTGQPVETPTTPAQPVRRSLGTGGGSVVASCAGGLAKLESWSPAQGYQADHVVAGPAQIVSIRFRVGGRGHGDRMGVVCQNDVPTKTAAPDD